MQILSLIGFKDDCMNKIYGFLCFISLVNSAFGQEHQHHAVSEKPAIHVEIQPLLSQASRLQEALSFSGSSFSTDDIQKLKALQQQAHTNESVRKI